MKKLLLISVMLPLFGGVYAEETLETIQPLEVTPLAVTPLDVSSMTITPIDVEKLLTIGVDAETLKAINIVVTKVSAQKLKELGTWLNIFAKAMAETDVPTHSYYAIRLKQLLNKIVASEDFTPELQKELDALIQQTKSAKRQKVSISVR